MNSWAVLFTSIDPPGQLLQLWHTALYTYVVVFTRPVLFVSVS